MPQVRRLNTPPGGPVLDDADVDAEPAQEEADEDVLEDTSDLEDDADVIGGDIEVEPEADEKDL